MNDATPNGWSKAEMFVLEKLGELQQGQTDIRAELVGARLDIAALKVKAGIWGAAAGAIAALGFKVLT